MHPFDYAKRKISESSQKLSQLLIWGVVIGIALIIIIAVIFIVVLGFDIAAIDMNDLYGLADAIFTAGAVGIALLAISGIALLIIVIMVYVQYYHLGSGFNILSEADQSVENSKNASYGIYGFLIATVVGIFAPGWAGSIFTIVASISLALGFYFVYQTFMEFKRQNRFSKEPTKFLLAAAIVNIISPVVTIFTGYGSFGSILGFILMLVGLRDLSRETTQVHPPGPAPVPSSVTVEAPKAQPPRAPAKEAEMGFIPKAEKITKPAEQRFCPNCGAKVGKEARFCTNCGANI